MIVMTESSPKSAGVFAAVSESGLSDSKFEFTKAGSLYELVSVRSMEIEGRPEEGQLRFLAAGEELGRRAHDLGSGTEELLAVGRVPRGGVGGASCCHIPA